MPAGPVLHRSRAVGKGREARHLQVVPEARLVADAVVCGQDDGELGTRDAPVESQRQVDACHLVGVVPDHGSRRRNDDRGPAGGTTTRDATGLGDVVALPKAGVSRKTRPVDSPGDGRPCGARRPMLHSAPARAADARCFGRKLGATPGAVQAPTPRRTIHGRMPIFRARRGPRPESAISSLLASTKRCPRTFGDRVGRGSPERRTGGAHPPGR